jgi:hypothetical protein
MANALLPTTAKTPIVGMCQKRKGLFTIIVDYYGECPFGTGSKSASTIIVKYYGERPFCYGTTASYCHDANSWHEEGFAIIVDYCGECPFGTGSKWAFPIIVDYYSILVNYYGVALFGTVSLWQGLSRVDEPDTLTRVPNKY